MDLNYDVVQFESCAIGIHFLDAYDPKGILLSKNNIKQRAMLHQLAFYCAGTLDNLNCTSSPVQSSAVAFGGANSISMLPPLNPVNQAAWNEYVAPYFEAILSQHTYLLGEEFTAADVVFGHSLFGLHTKPVSPGQGPSWLDANKHPSIWRYQKLLESRQAYQRAYSDGWLKVKHLKKGLLLEKQPNHKAKVFFKNFWKDLTIFTLTKIYRI